jgi:hypothetical protein
MKFFGKRFVGMRLDTERFLDREDLEEERKFSLAKFLGYLVAEEGGIRG